MGKPTFEDVVEIIKPLPDSQYRLQPCRCGSSEVVYASYIGTLSRKDLGYVGGIHASGTLWRVVCTACGKTVDNRCLVRHDAQVAWNRRK